MISWEIYKEHSDLAVYPGGLFYDWDRRKAFMVSNSDETKMVPMEYTFEAAIGRGALSSMLVGWVGLTWFDRRLNPFKFATMETANRMLDYMVNVIDYTGMSLSAHIVEQLVVPPGHRTVERSIRVTKLGTGEHGDFNAGSFAVGVSRFGRVSYRKSVIDELKGYRLL